MARAPAPGGHVAPGREVKVASWEGEMGCPPPGTGMLSRPCQGFPLQLVPTCLLSTHRTEASPRTMEGREGELRKEKG